jgi:hypothetical protein
MDCNLESQPQSIFCDFLNNSKLPIIIVTHSQTNWTIIKVKQGFS